MTAAGSAGTPADGYRVITHHPHLLTGGRHGAWCVCPCGWTSGIYRTVLSAHLERLGTGL